MKIQFDDGANVQAKIILALLEDFEIEESWDNEYKRYSAELKAERWHNCREQGYSVAVRPKKYGKHNPTIQIIWCEYRSADCITIREYKGSTINPVTVHDMEEQEESWSTVKSFNYGQWIEAAEYIKGRITEIYLSDNAGE